MEAEQLTIEEQAAAQGWNSDYDGPNAKSAEQFIADGEKIAPIQKERNNKLVKDIADLKKSMDEFKTMHIKTIHETREQAYNKAVTDLKKKQLEAVEEADTAKFEKIEGEIQSLEKPKAPVVEKATDVSPEFTEWNAQNDWYMKNDEMTAYADMLGSRLQSKYDDTPDGRSKFFKAIEVGVKKAFREDFGGNGSNAPDVETPSGGGGKKKGKTLPPEAKAAAEKYIKEGLFKNEAEYAKQYWGIK